MAKSWMLILFIQAFTMTQDKFGNFVCAIEVTQTEKYAQDYSQNLANDEATLLEISKNIIGSCIMHINSASNEDYMRPVVLNKTKSLSISIFPPSKAEILRYNDIVETLTRVNPALAEGKVLGNSRVQAWFETANNWQLPESHPRNNKTRCYAATVIAGKEVSTFYKVMRKETSLNYLIHTNNALIHGTGIIGKECGYIQAHESCETIFKFLGRKWHNSCRNGISKLKLSWSSVWDNTNKSINALLSACPEKHEKFSSPIKRHKKVFIITAGWDSNYHHFMLDSLSRLIRHIDFLKANPDIKIHIRAIEQSFKKQDYVKAGRELRERLFNMVGIDMNRVISGQVYADEVFYPKGTACNAPTSIAYELRLLVRYFFKKSYPESADFLRISPEAKVHGLQSMIQAASDVNNTLAIMNKKKNIVIQHRPCYTVKDCDKNWRTWNNMTAHTVELEFIKMFPNHNVILMNSHDSYWTNCMPCQIRTYANTDILVGLHGAGLTNIVFMPPNSLIVELAAQFDGRMQPLCGYHGPLSAVFGVHHYIHFYDWKLNLRNRPKEMKLTGGVLVNATALVSETFSFFNELRNLIS